MGIFLSIVFFASILIQIIYYLFIFTKLIAHVDYEINDTQYPPVSIIIAAANELENLKELLPLLDQQDYPEFEIVLADDRSNDGTYDYLLFNKDHIKHLNFLRIKDLPEHFTAKKYAVTMAIKKSKYEYLLFTDADCRPESTNWIKQMVSQLSAEKEIVLGFSPYTQYLGKLNELIRYETFQTAIQYLSFALARIPFMGVGRNMMYKKSLFWMNKGFASHQGLLSGDDDLFVNAAATKDNVAICIEPMAHVLSEPKLTWKDWIIQKRRHLSVGKRYKTKDKLSLGVLWMSRIFIFLLFIPVFFISPDWFQAPEWSIISNEYLKQYGLKPWLPFSNWMKLVLGIQVFWLALKWFILSNLNKKLNNTISNWKILIHDFMYTVYLICVGAVSIFTNPKKIKWR